MKRRRYPGSKPFETAQQDIFFGRNRDIADLTKLIELEQSVVLYGKSGLGKSSLIEAGIIPKIAEQEKYEIIKIRFGAYVEGQHEVAPLAQALEYLKSDNNWLDEQFKHKHKSNFNFDNLWHALKRRQINDERDGYLLIFDQFEELFTYPEAQVADFARQLAEVQYTNIPQHYHDLIDEGFDADEHFLSDDQMRQLHRQLQVKTLMGIRSDRMSYMNQLKPYLPEVLVHTYELKALGTTAASDAIRKPALPQGDFLSAPFDYDDIALRNILRYLTKDNTQGIESFQLQIFCEHIEDLVIQHKHPIISLAQIGTQEDVERIFENYYRDKIADFGSPDQQLAVRRLIEEGLIFEAEERRLNLYEGQITKQYKVTKALLDQLVDSRLLRAEPSMRGGYTYELSHDTLVAPVLKAKAERIAEEARQAAAILEKQRQQELAEAQAKAEKERRIAEQERQIAEQQRQIAEQQKQIAGEEKQRADREKQLRIRAKNISAIAIALFLIALLAAVFAFYQSNVANEAKIEAERERDRSQEQYQQRINLEINNIIKDVNKLIGVDQNTQARAKLNEAYKLDSTNVEVKKLLQGLK